jgi:pSer/pThr/pTyr-binding forkhead associated (FHA) protein
VKLVVLEGPAARASFEVEGPRTLIGRAPDCDVLVFDAQVSRHHAQLMVVGGQLVIESLQHSNPVIVNDHLVAIRERLVDGDLIVVGGVLFEVDIPPPTTRDAALSHDDVPPVAERWTPRPPAHPPPPPLDSARQVAGRLAEAGQRIATRAAAHPSTSPVNAGDTAAVDAIMSDHERLGGDAELARLAGLLSERLTNQTDIRGLYRLGAEAGALIAWSRIARRSIDEVSHLADVLGAR